MEAIIRLRNGALTIKVEAANQKDLFREIASQQEVFDADCQCGKCNSKNLRFRTRTNKKGNEFFELVCQDCWARLDFGQHQGADTLFPRRARGEGDMREPIDHRGWYHYEAEPAPEQDPFGPEYGHAAGYEEAEPASAPVPARTAPTAPSAHANSSATAYRTNAPSSNRPTPAPSRSESVRRSGFRP